MKIEQLQQLLQIVAEGSMNEAAQKLVCCPILAKHLYEESGSRTGRTYF